MQKWPDFYSINYGRYKPSILWQ